MFLRDVLRAPDGDDPELPFEPVLTPRRRGLLWRMPLRHLSLRRVLMGGRLGDGGRLPRYAAVFLLGVAAIWVPILTYLKTAPVRYTSSMSLILPGSGVSASVNLDDIGQATSYSNSAFASNAVSPTETYKRLISANRILAAAAASLGIDTRDLGAPRITLVDQTGLIHVQMTGETPEDAQARLNAVMQAFYAELDRLRADETQSRASGGDGAIEEYRASVQRTRAAITELQKRTGLLSIDQYDAMVAENDRLRAEVEGLRASLEQQEEIVQSLSDRLGLTADQAAAALKLFADAEYLAIVRQMSDSAATLAQLDARHGPNHPQVERARAAYYNERTKALTRAVFLTGLPEMILGRIDLAPDGARAELLAELVRHESLRAGLQAQWQEQSARLERETARLRELAPLAAKLQDLQRDFAVAEAVFASAIARSQSTKSDPYGSYPLVQVLEDPSLPDEPSSPRPKLAVAAGIAATVLMLIGLVLGWIRGPLIGWLLAKGRAA
ncbi:uncharacterized protein involved in exopolysaccharide biosynthesis [Albidovulum inexpectatum]|uniref:Uncharacterized protein involved in exopolysaccharide biosynthesis n=1 Tax=Albidovulum inexpectatum TaxID=196587 RepID=A0A2S5JH37_9RHOB|nr:hypothetical protein [Albidovulum inexpectatum]PPB80701.1 uncharacterized protein involved in exopolysaccharide biosynthesis [Albidovulum inexpectatum]